MIKMFNITFFTIFHKNVFLILLILLPLLVTPKLVPHLAEAQETGQQQFQQPQQQFQQPQQQLPYPVTNVPVGLSPFGVSYNSENGYVYIANFYSNSVS